MLTDHVLHGAGKPASGICTAAFSGGADSTALLLCLWQLRDTLGIDLRAVHVHHGIRGAEADRDAAFCEAFCRQHDIPFQLCSVDAPAYAKAQRLSLETAARILRYDALMTAAPEGDIATAHHAGDNAETMLFHLMRGTGLSGLRGIPPRSGRIIRPLLSAEKPEILAFLREHHQDYVEDSTNADSFSTRNRIRGGIMPLMEAENPSYLRAMTQTAEILREDEALLSALAEQAYAECADADGAVRGLSAYQRPVRMRVYMNMLRNTGIDASFESLRRIDSILCENAGKITIAENRTAQIWQNALWITEPDLPLCDRLPLTVGENRFYAGRVCTAVLTDALSWNNHKTDTRSTLDFDKIKGSVFFRQRTGTDRICLPGRDFASTLKKRIQAEVPLPLRNALHTLYDEEGCICCERIGIAARVKPDANSRRILTLSFAADAHAARSKQKEWI